MGGGGYMVCTKQGPKIEGDVLLRIGLLVFFRPKQSQVFIPSGAHLYPNNTPLPPPPELTGSYDNFRHYLISLFKCTS